MWLISAPKLPPGYGPLSVRCSPRWILWMNTGRFSTACPRSTLIEVWPAGGVITPPTIVGSPTTALPAALVPTYLRWSLWQLRQKGTR